MLRENYKFLIISLIALLFTDVTIGQKISLDIYTQFSNYNDENGLSNNNINDIIQDNNGFIWIATDNGLNRFDGYTFVNFFHNPDDSLTISGNIITSLTIDKNENLWIGTTSGLCRLSLRTGKIVRLPAISGITTSPRTDNIRKILYTPQDDILWFETLEGTLSQYNIATNIWNHHIHQAITQPYYKYHVIYRDRRGELWIGGRNIPLLKFNLGTQTFQTFKSGGNVDGAKRDDDVADIMQTSAGDYYVVATDGIYLLNTEKEYWKKILATSTFSIAEDSSGYLWFGSGNGLLRYSPQKNTFTGFRHNISNPLSIIDNSINKVFIDKTGNIWIGTRNGLSCLSRKTKQFDYYYHIPGVGNGLASNEVTALAKDQNGKVYIGTESHGLNIWDPENNSFEHYRHNDDDKCSIASDKISSIYIDKKGVVWLGLWAGVGFNRFNPQNKCFTRYAIDYTSRKRDWYNAFLEVGDGNFIVGFWGSNGATYFNRQKGEFESKDFITYDKPYYRPVHQILNDGKGTFFFVSNIPYLFVYSTENDEYFSLNFSKQFAQSPEKLGLEGKNLSFPFDFENIYDMVSDGEGLSYIATDKGIIGFTKSKGFFTVYKTDIQPISIHAWGNDRLIVATRNELLVFSSAGEIIKRFNLKLSPEAKLKISMDGEVFIADGNTVTVIDPKSTHEGFVKSKVKIFDQEISIETFEVDSNSIWVGSRLGLHYVDLKNTSSLDRINFEKEIITSPVTQTLNNVGSNLLVFSATGFYKIDKQNFRSTLIPIDSQPEGFSTAVKTAAMVNDSTVWIGNEIGHFNLNLNTGKLINTSLPSSRRASSHLVSTLLEDDKGNLWIGTTDKGLNRVDKSTGRIHHFYGGSDNLSLPGNYVNTTLQTSDGRIWVGTDKGLCYVSGDFVVKIPELLNLYSINSLVEDNQGNIWAGTDKGLLFINIFTGQIKQFDDSHGLPAGRFNRSVLKLDEKLVFGTNKGFIVFNPEKLLSSADFGNRISITQFNVFGNPIKYQFSQADTVNLNYNQNFFQINFSGFDFGFKPGTKYLYKLHGVNPDWVSSASQFTSYTNVQPGKYIFEVTRVLPNGNPDTSSISLNIFIKPPFWQTLWFRLTFLFLIAGGVGAYLIIYIRQLKTDRLNVELEQKLLISQMNPHFIFNSLTAIQSFMYNNEPEEAGNYLSSFSRLVRLILENSRSAYIPVKQEVQTLSLYLMLQKLRFPNKFEYEIFVDPTIDTSSFYLPPLLAQPFIENSIEHGIMGMEGNGFILISINRENDLFCITVEDNGIGVNKSIQNNQKKRLNHTSHATSITRDRIKTISSGRDKKVGITIVDLISENKQGTRVQLRFPIKQNINH